MKTIILGMVVVLMAATARAGEKVTVTVKGMVCSFCAQGLDKKFKADPAVDKVDVSLEKKTILLELKDDATINDGAIKKIVQDAGYNVHSIKRDR